MLQGPEGRPEIKTAFVCKSGDCAETGSLRILEGLRQLLQQHAGAPDVKPHECFGVCFGAPAVTLAPRGPVYIGVQKSDLNEIAKNILGGSVVNRLVMSDNPPLVDLIHEILEAEERGELPR